LFFVSDSIFDTGVHFTIEQTQFCVNIVFCYR